ncbi:hypothetical protein EOM39_03695 [Candidatus Gracilibacteria bacterium]|nr:hypothetical protein [Candidatus Gracilibacteria bacterium]
MDKKINWGDKLKEMGILWQFDGDYTKPHALWTSGMHGDTFNNGSKLVENPRLLSEIVSGIIVDLEPLIKKEKPDWIIGPAFGAITLGHELARQLGTKFAFTEPVQTPEGKMQVLKRFDIKKGDRVLVVEDAISTGGSIVKTIAILEGLGAEVLPFVATIVNWSGNEYLGTKKIFSLYSGIPKKWEQDDCELCKKGSIALRPKANWDKFTYKNNI